MTTTHQLENIVKRIARKYKTDWAIDNLNSAAFYRKEDIQITIKKPDIKNNVMKQTEAIMFDKKMKYNTGFEVDGGQSLSDELFEKILFELDCEFANKRIKH